VPNRHGSPSHSRQWLFRYTSDYFFWSLFTGVEGRAMRCNIFLDGNTFESSPSVDFIADANAELSFTYGKTQLSYTFNWRSKEFDRQEEPSLFGAASL
tara:strand:+ start:316 stop:609 length:294 start_codon:yes stop_codon:yes gene_type:complete